MIIFYKIFYLQYTLIQTTCIQNSDFSLVWLGVNENTSWNQQPCFNSCKAWSMISVLLFKKVHIYTVNFSVLCSLFHKRTVCLLCWCPFPDFNFIDFPNVLWFSLFSFSSSRKQIFPIATYCTTSRKYVCAWFKAIIWNIF